MAINSINNGDIIMNDISKKVNIVDNSNSLNISNVSTKLERDRKPPTANSNGDQTETRQDISSEKKFKDAITDANNKLIQKRTRCEFSYNEDVNRISIKVYDRQTDEVLKEIPADETLEMLEKIWDLAGLLVDEKR